MKDKKVIVSFNNGSVPPQYAYRYEIIFSNHGTALLEVYKGFDIDEKNVFSETKKINTLVFEQLVLGVINLKFAADNNLAIGGSQRSIELINGKSEKFFIENENLLAINLFNRFLYLYDLDFLNNINKIINH